MNTMKLKAFLDYCWSVLDVNTEEKEKTQISFSYSDGLIMKVKNIKGFSTNYLKCDVKDYERIINEINASFILHNAIKNVTISSNTYQIESDNITINFDINNVNLETLKQQLSKIKERKMINRNDNEEVTDFKKANNICRLYINYLKTCSKESEYTIYPFYSLGFFIIKIDNGEDLSFYRKIACTKKTADELLKKLCEDFMTNNIEYSEISPITTDKEQLQTLIDKGFVNHFYTMKGDNFTLRFSFDINYHYYSQLNERVLEKINSKKLTLKY